MSHNKNKRNKLLAGTFGRIKIENSKKYYEMFYLDGRVSGGSAGSGRYAAEFRDAHFEAPLSQFWHIWPENRDPF